MRVLLAVGMAATLALLACGGCSSQKMPSLPTFGFKGKSSKPSSSTLAPPGPEFNAMADNTPNVSMPSSSAAWSNLPVYPGTNYQQTPYPDHVVAQAPPAYATGVTSATTVPMANPASGYTPMPQANSVGPTNPYQSYPATGAAPSYSAPQTPVYSPSPTSGYAPQGASAYPPQAAAPPTQPPGYGGQQTTPYSATPAQYAQQPQATVPATTPAAQPYSAPTNPYGATSEPYNAANPYGPYTR